ncbi:hypothetical protein F7731_23775 [Cytobacillus depressus]|uniref:Helix-turn-helix domain-containing protein n=1 Tax=Cytobacillus depressus TaxID=1602942 RepID=A0A6L3UXY5_9BACI|nr:hypothetical protein [Cytobacillus depressus]KAB2328972.1 hypothetical protein F7731_23775 [Cytobacillus depressus]
MSKNTEKTEPTHAELIWGSQILDEGFTIIPNIITRNYRNLGMTHGEYAFIALLSTFKHDTKDPYPSQTTLAKLYFGEEYKEENSERAIRKIVNSLKKKTLLRTGKRRNVTSGKFGNSVYSLQPLINACLKLQGEKQIELPVEYDIEWDDEPQEQKVPTVPEQKVPMVPEQKVPVVPEQKVPTKKKREKESIKKKKEKESIYQEIVESNLPVSLQKVLVDRIDRLIIYKIKLIDVELHFNAFKDQYEEREYIYVLQNLIDGDEKPKKFAAVMNNWLKRNRENQNNIPAKSGKQKPIRTEMEQEHMEDKPEKEKSPDDEAVLAEKKKTLEETLKKLKEPNPKRLA